jgi:hypothetical protein
MNGITISRIADPTRAVLALPAWASRSVVVDPVHRY